MLHYAIIALIVAIIAGVLGFGGIAGTAAWIAKVSERRFEPNAVPACLPQVAANGL